MMLSAPVIVVNSGRIAVALDTLGSVSLRHRREVPRPQAIASNIGGSLAITGGVDYRITRPSSALSGKVNLDGDPPATSCSG